MPNVPLHLLPDVLHVSPPIVPAVTSHVSSTGSGPAAGPTVKKLSPVEVEIHLPRVASYWSSLGVPPSMEALTCSALCGAPPKSTSALTPIEHEAATLKYGSG